MMPMRVQSEELNIHQVREPREGMPELGIERRKGPPNRLHSEPVLNVPVFGYVPGIIQIDKIAIRDLPEGDEGGGEEEEDKEKRLFCRQFIIPGISRRDLINSNTIF